jgi:DNA-binding PadR family transcriptional regulator
MPTSFLTTWTSTLSTQSIPAIQWGVALGAVYTTLLRLEEKRLVASRLGDPTPQRGGRRKKYYRPLAAGRRELAASLHALRRMTRGLTPGLELP